MNDVDLLAQASCTINSTLNLDEIYSIVLRTMADRFDFKHSMILLLDESGKTLTVVAARGYPESGLGAKVEVGVGVIGTVAKRRKLMRIGNLAAQRAYAETVRREVEAAGRGAELQAAPSLPGLKDAQSQIAIPMTIKDRLVGVFSVESASRRVFEPRDEMLATIVANMAATAIHNAMLYRKVEGQLENYRAKEGRRLSLDDLVGRSAAIRSVKELLRKVAKSPSSTVLITGENGTGKDLAAKIVHALSARAAGPFMNITCSAIAETLLESELFGYEKGAFTDARAQKKGLLELADGGSVFLDEIGEMSLALQAKLLRVLEEKTFKRVGGGEDVRVDVRVIAATNRDLERLVREGRFRQDLYYRLRVLPIELPPLRDRREDLPLLASMFLKQFAAEFRKEVVEISPEAMKRMHAYDWPGNVRELRNAVERAVLLTESRVVQPEDFTPGGASTGGFRLPPDGLRFEELEKDLVLQALKRSNFNKAQAAKLLGMDRDWVRYRMEKYKIRE